MIYGGVGSWGWVIRQKSPWCLRSTSKTDPRQQASIKIPKNGRQQIPSWKYCAALWGWSFYLLAKHFTTFHYSSDQVHFKLLRCLGMLNNWTQTTREIKKMLSNECVCQKQILKGQYLLLVEKIQSCHIWAFAKTTVTVSQHKCWFFWGDSIQ